MADNGDEDKVAVIGYSCRFPGANNPEEFWENLIEGVDSVGPIPPDRWYIPGNRQVEFGFLKCLLDEFDASFFNLSPKQAHYMDPQQRLFLEVVWEALESAGIAPSSLKKTQTGIYMGICVSEYEKQMDSIVNDKDFLYEFLGVKFSSLVGRLAHVLDTHGPALAVETACSSSAVAIHMGCQALRAHECPIVIVGGVHLILDANQRFPPPMLSSRCKSFDASASGFVPAEGCGVVVLKLLKDAIKDGDNILGVILGSAINHDGLTRNFGAPNPNAQVLVIEKALKDAKISSSDLNFLEAHGTGTQMGDICEIQAINEVFASKRNDELIVTATKTNIGHTLSASGIASFIKVILSLNHKKLTRLLHFKTLNSKLDLTQVPLRFPLENIDIKKLGNGKPLIASMNSFGLSGTNAHIIIQEPPQNHTTRKVIEPSYHLLTISAKTESALESLVEKYEQLLTGPASAEFSFADFAYSLNTGRDHYPNRIGVIAKNKKDFVNQLRLKNYIEMRNHPQTSKEIGEERIAFLFTGQGSQYVGMGKSLYEVCSLFKSAIDFCDAAFFKEFQISLKKYIWEAKDEEELKEFAAPALFCMQYSLFQVWKEQFGIRPYLVLGHSVGEFAACVAAGVLSFEEAMKLVCGRSRLINSLIGPRGKMAAVRAANVEEVTELISKFTQANSELDNWIDIAAINSSNQVVVAGKSNTISNFATFYENEMRGGIKVLNTSHAFHSRHMAPILEEFGRLAETMKPMPPSCVYVSSTEAKVFENETKFSANYWVRHLREKVEFSKALDLVIQEKECRFFIEIGPSPILLSLVSNSSSFVLCPSLKHSEPQGWETMLKSLGNLYVSSRNIKIDWNKVHGEVRRRKIKLPHYPFQRKKFWLSSPKHVPNNYFTGPNVPQLMHPLLGRKLELAEEYPAYFANSLAISSSEYFIDHIVADQVLMPGACFLEMGLGVGQILFEDLSFLIENSIIKSGLFLTEIPCQLQTRVVHSEGNTNSFDFQIHSIPEGKVKWTNHFVGKITPLSSDSKGNHLILKNNKEFNFNSEKFFESDSVLHIECEKIYEAFLNVGIKMGQQFQSLEKMWTNTKNGEFLFKTIPHYQSSKYVCHPITIDAMIQAFWYSSLVSSVSRDSLMLPIGFEKFVWLKRETNKKRKDEYFHILVKSGQKVEQSVCLYDSDGSLMAIMEGISLVDTTMSAIRDSAFNQHGFVRKNMASGVTNQPIDLYEEIWVEIKTVATVDRFQINTTSDLNSLEFSEFLENIRTDDILNREDFDKNLELLDKISYMYILKAFYHCGWVPELGKVYTVEEITRELCLTNLNPSVLLRFLMILTEEEILVHSAGNGIKSKFTLVSIPPNLNEVERFLKNNEGQNSEDPDLQFLHYCGSQLFDIFKENQTPLKMLYSTESLINAPFYFAHSKAPALENHRLALAVENIIKNSKGGGIIRILEVGAGTGATTFGILKKIKHLGVQFHYTFTDISSSFLTLPLQQKFLDYVPHIEFRVLNIDEDPLDQGFCPESYDMIIGSNVFHATKDLKVTLTNCRKLIVDGGYLLAVELLPFNRVCDISFGLLSGWWSFEDFRQEANYPLVCVNTWFKVFAESGFGHSINLSQTSSVSIDCFVAKADKCVYAKNKKAWIILNIDADCISAHVQTKLQGLGFSVIKFTERQELTIEEIAKFCQHANSVHGILFMSNLNRKNKFKNIIDSIDLAEKGKLLINNLLVMFQYGLTMPELAKVFVVTAGVAKVLKGGTDEELNPLSAPSWGMLRTFLNENPEIKGGCIDLDFGILHKEPERCTLQIISQLWEANPQVAVAFRGRQCFTPYLTNFQEIQPEFQDLAIPSGADQRFRIIEGFTGSYKNLSVDLISNTDTDSELIEVRVQAAALNFHDIAVMSNLIPSIGHEKYWTPGGDYAGIITKISTSSNKKFCIGDRVFGILAEGALSSHISIQSENLMMKIPDSWSFFEAASAPTVFITAYYALFEIGKVAKGEHVLIHTASGGVGLAAIQLLKLLGAEIYVTAGSRRKRNYLRQVLGLDRVYSSRNHEYLNKIKKYSPNGQGIDVILNSITGAGFKEASLACLKKDSGARFIEMSKLNIWTKEDLISFRPDVNYDLIRIDELTTYNPNALTQTMQELEKLFHSGKLEPIPYTLFPISKTKDAFKYFYESKHIGKIVLNLGQSLFYAEHTYLITGGLGGIGLKIADWILDNGGSNVILVGRNPSKEENVVTKFNKLVLKSNGKLKFISADISNFNECEELLSKLKNFKGIFHCAGILADRLISNQTKDNFILPFKSKMDGAWNLHELTKCLSLDYFVLFSSFLVHIGAVGQSNYCGANAFMDALTQYRVHELGLKANSINWGPWAEVGLAVCKGFNREEFPSFKPGDALFCLKQLLVDFIPCLTYQPQVGIANIESSVVNSYPKLKDYLSKLRRHTGQKPEKNQMTKTKFSSCMYDSGKSEQMLVSLVQELEMSTIKELGKIALVVETVVRFYTGIPNNENIDYSQSMRLLGVDSLTELELRNKFNSLLQIKLHNSIFQQHGTIQSFSEYLFGILNDDKL